MANALRSYKRNIAEGSGILFFSISVGIILRVVYLFNMNYAVADSADGYLWKLISPLFGNVYVSLLVSSLFVAMMALLSSHINTKYVLIRNKSLLPPSIIILLFSIHPVFFCMSAEYVSALLFLFIVDALFSAYYSERKQNEICAVGALLALSSLFTPVSIMYLPVLWCVLGFMRSFNFKTILASLVGVLCVCFPVYSFFLLTDNMEAFVRPFVAMNWEGIGNFAFFDYDVLQWALLGVSVLLMVAIISDGYINRHKDKIRVRAYLNLLVLVSLFAILAFVFLNINPFTHLYIALALGALLLSHFFALVERKITVAMFYITIIFYIVVSFYFFLSI